MSIRPRSIVFYSEHNLVGRKLERPWSLTLRKLASDTWNKMRIVKNVLFGHGYGYRQHCQAQKEREKERESEKRTIIKKAEARGWWKNVHFFPNATHISKAFECFALSCVVQVQILAFIHWRMPTVSGESNKNATSMKRMNWIFFAHIQTNISNKMNREKNRIYIFCDNQRLMFSFFACKPKSNESSF